MSTEAEIREESAHFCFESNPALNKHLSLNLNQYYVKEATRMKIVCLSFQTASLAKYC